MNTGKVVLGVLAGAAVGAILGILFAPDKGSDTRKKIAKKSHDYAEDVKEKFNDFIESVSEKYEKAKDDVSGFADHLRHKSDETEKDVKNG